MNIWVRAQRFFRFAAALFLMLSAVFARPAQAAPATYTLTIDTVLDSNAITYQMCTQAANDCSLRGAISFANRTTQFHYVLVLSPDFYSLSLPGANEDDNATGDLDIATDLIIQGNGAILRANRLDRVLDVHAGDVWLENLTLSGGAAPNGAVGSPPNPAGGGAPGGAVRYAAPGGTLTLKNCRVAANFAGNGGAGGAASASGPGGAGGGIYAVAGTTVALVLSQVEGNQAGRGGDGGPGGSGAPGGPGGGIFSLGLVTLERSSVSFNTSGAGGDGGSGGGTGGGGGSGGGVAAAQFIAAQSMLEANAAAGGGTGGGTGNGGAGGDGGGVVILGSASPSTLINTSLYGNLAGSGGPGGLPGGDGEGGGLTNLGAVSLNFVTLTQNVSGASADLVRGYGGGLVNHGSLAVKNSIIADNYRAWNYTRDDCFTYDSSTALASYGHNLFSTTAGCLLTYPTQDHTNLININPGLLPPAWLGGFTRTVGLVTTSPALNVAPCVDWEGAAVSQDQRGFPRPIGPGCDSGAFERMPYSYNLPLVNR